MSHDDHEATEETGLERLLGIWLSDQAGRGPREPREYLEAYDRLAPAAPASPLASGETELRQIGPYRIEREAGRGGQGLVFLASDTRLERTVALKLLTAVGGRPEATLERFRREALVASRLDHPDLCGVLDAGVEAGIPWIAMPWIEGRSLAEILAGGPGPGAELRRDPGAAAALVERCARALHAAHEAGVIHRDIKPGNIMVKEDGGPVILDFGLARDEGLGDTRLTRTGETFGTPLYMAPEQIAPAAGEPGSRTDVWALGAVLYELVTGAPPFAAPTRHELELSILGSEPADPRRANPDVGRDLRAVILTALEKQPSRRHATALAMAEDLQRVREGRPVLARPVGPLGRTWRWALRNRGLAAALGALFLALVTGLILVATESRRANRALDDYRQLEDGVLARQLVEEFDRLWPPLPERVFGPAGMDAWIASAESLWHRLAAHSARLNALQARAQPWTEAERAADREMLAGTMPDLSRERELLAHEAGEDDLATERRDEVERRLAAIDAEISARIKRRSYRFSDAGDQIRHDLLAGLVEEIARLEGLLERMRARRLLAINLDRRCFHEAKDAWEAAARDVAAHPRFAGLMLRPQRGLVPLGPDPRSGLQEFAHVPSGAVPVRDAAGVLGIEEGSAIVLVLIPGGPARIGAQRKDPALPHFDPAAIAPRERPVHDVPLDPYFLAKHEVSQAQWFRLTGRNPSQFRNGISWRLRFDALHPVESVSWAEATEALSRLTLGLPTEVQWEHAARAGTDTPWWTGATIPAGSAAANLADESWGRTFRRGARLRRHDGFPAHARIDVLEANPFGLQGLIGNVAEWCRDGLATYDQPVRPGDGERLDGEPSLRVIRGGGFESGLSQSRSAYRDAATADHRSSNTGLRPARPLDR